MKKLVLIFTVFAIVATSTMSFADETKAATIFQSTAYGAIIGAMVGAAFLAFEDNPGDNMQFLYQGAAVGALAGTAYGFYEAETFAKIENGKVKFAMPTIKTQVIGKEIRSSADLLKVTF